MKFGVTVDYVIVKFRVFPTLSEGVKQVAQVFSRDVSLVSCCLE